MGELLIEKVYPLDFFDGTIEGPKYFYSVGRILFFSDNYFIKLKVGLGPGSKNSAKLLTLGSLLKLEIEKEINHFHVYGGFFPCYQLDEN